MSIARQDEGRTEDRAKAETSIDGNASLTVPYVTMNALATVVACYGLLQDSAAVVIGAMIIATLLGPISGIALALVIGDLALLRKAFLAESVGAMAALAIAMLLGWIHQGLPLTSQILSRTSPSLLDLMIALAGGAAGAYATISPRVSVGLVGVAIATALVPPLSACGLCLARGESKLALGAFLLFFTNLVAIQFASSLVMVFHGFHRAAALPQPGQTVLKRNAFSFLILVTLGAVFSVNFAHSIARERFEHDTRSRLNKALEEYPGAYLADLRFRETGASVEVTAVVRAPYSFVPSRVAALQDRLRAPDGEAITLHVRSIITKESTPGGYVNDVEDMPDDSSATGLSQ